MKFTDGYWLLREGVTAAHPVEVLDVTDGSGTLEIHAPTQPIRHRGDLLKGPVVTISAHAPMPDVIGVTFTHFEGEEPHGPQFELGKEEFAAHTEHDEESATLTSGALSVRVTRTGPWHVDFLADGRTLTTSGPKGMGIMRNAGTGGHYLREQLNLGVGHAGLRARRALRAAGQERPGRRHVERRRRHGHANRRTRTCRSI